MSEGAALIRPIERKPGEVGLTHVFWCPACRCAHGVSVREPGPVWVISGPESAPTIVPSVKCEVITPPPESKLLSRCHVNVQGGMIHYCPDSTHEFAGRVVAMEAF